MLSSLSLLAAGLLAVAPSTLDVKSAAWASSSNFVYEVKHMPDLDQRRMAGSGILGLAGDGSMYCVPTSTLNLMIYAANHGYSFLPPGNGYWALPGFYNPGSLNLAVMGALMNTSASNGTNGNGWFNGAKTWVAPYGLFTVNHYYAGGNWAPKVSNLGQSAIGGSIVAFAYGRYEKVGEIGGIPILDRDGGHAVTLVKAAAAGNSLVLQVRDPADDPDSGSNPNYKLSQSAFTTRSYNVANQMVVVGSFPSGLRLMTSLNYDAAKEKNAYVDSYLTIRPKFGLTFINTGPDVILKLVLPNKSFKPIGQLDSDLLEVFLPQGNQIVAAALNTDQSSAWVLTQNPTTGKVMLNLTDLLSKETQPLTEIPDAKQVCVGRDRSVYILTDDKIICFDPDRIEFGTAASSSPGMYLNKMLYNDETDQLFVLAANEKKVLCFDKGLQNDPMQMSFPEGFEMDGQIAMAIPPCANPKLWITAEYSPGILQLPLGSPTGNADEKPVIVKLPGVDMPSSLQFDDACNLFVVNMGRILEFKENEDGNWVQIQDSPWKNYTTGGSFEITRSRTNYDPAQHSGPAWDNIEPDTVEKGRLLGDCAADLNKDGVIDETDGTLLKAKFGTSDPDADLNQDGKVDEADLQILRSNMGVCH